MAKSDHAASSPQSQPRGAQPHRDGHTRRATGAPRWVPHKVEMTECACGFKAGSHIELKQHLRKARGKGHRAV